MRPRPTSSGKRALHEVARRLSGGIPERATAILGAPLIIAGFLVEQVDRYRPLLRLMTPMYARTLDGADGLESSGVLTPSDAGFSELSNVAMSEARKWTPADVATSQFTIERFVRRHDMTTIAPEPDGIIHVFLRGHPTPKVWTTRDWLLRSTRGRAQR